MTYQIKEIILSIQGLKTLRVAIFLRTKSSPCWLANCSGLLETALRDQSFQSGLTVPGLGLGHKVVYDIHLYNLTH